MSETKTEVKGKCFLIGQGNFVKNPNTPRAEVSDSSGRAIQAAGTKQFEFETAEMAVALGEQLAQRNPGTYFHVLQTAFVLGAEVKPAERLQFVNA